MHNRTRILGLAMYYLGRVQAGELGLMPGDLAARVAPDDPALAEALDAAIDELRRRPSELGYPSAEELADPARALRIDLQQLG